MSEKLSKLTDIQGQLPDLISNLTGGTGEALTGALAKAKDLLPQIPELLKSVMGN